jgi:hypothetical protein
MTVQTTAFRELPETGGVPRRSPRIPLGALHRIAVLAAICGLAMLPVEYRGGAKDPHPHAAYQLWYDAAHGSVVHHHAWAEVPASTHHPSATAPAWVGGEDDPDVPRLVGLSIGAVKVPLVATAIALLIAPAAMGARVVWPPLPVLVGRPLRAETPPPRPALLPA